MNVCRMDTELQYRYIWMSLLPIGIIWIRDTEIPAEPPPAHLLAHLAHLGQPAAPHSSIISPFCSVFPV